MAESSVSNPVKTLHQSVIQWTAAAGGDTFAAAQLSRVPYSIMIAVTGTFGAAASIALHGSLDGTNYFALKDRSDTAIAITAAGLANVGDAPLYIKPVLSAGDGSTAAVVKVLVWHESV